MWEASLKEVDDGFLRGPFDISVLPCNAVVSPRFAIWQKGKLRPIDNFSASNVNSAVGLPEKLKVEAVDEAAAVIKAWIAKAGPGCKLVGKTYDLKKAYRQLPIRKDSLHAAWVAVWNPFANSAQVFQMETLPFGATASVAAFLRAAEALKFLGRAELAFAWCSFFDDFICACNEQDADATDEAVQLFFKLLGWTLSTDPDKTANFGPCFNALGVVFDLSNSANGSFTIGKRRKAELIERIDEVLDAGVFKKIFCWFFKCFPRVSHACRVFLDFSKVFPSFSRFFFLKIFCWMSVQHHLSSAFRTSNAAARSSILPDKEITEVATVGCHLAEGRWE